MGDDPTGEVSRARADADAATRGLDTLVAIVREWTAAQVEQTGKIDALHGRLDALEREINSRGEQLARLVQAAEQQAAAAQGRTTAIAATLSHPVVQQVISVLALGLVAWLLMQLGVWDAVAPTGLSGGSP